MDKELRYYQQKAIQSVGNELINNGIKSQMLVMATGTGKTFTVSKIVCKDKFKRTLWLTHSEELIEQSAIALATEIFSGDKEVLKLISKIKEEDGVIKFLDQIDLFSSPAEKRFRAQIGIIKQKRLDLDSRVIIASVQTIHRRLEFISKNHFDLVIADECHFFLAKSFLKALIYFKPILRLGLTATPERADGFSMDNIFDKISYQYNINKAVADGNLCNINAIQVQTELSLDDVKTTGGDLNQKDLRIIDIPERNLLIVDKYIEYANGRQAIAFCIDMQHAMHLCSAFKQRGIISEFVVSDKDMCPNRKELIDGYKDGKIQVLVNVMILTTGFDHPDTGAIILARPTKSKTVYLQSVGRGMRLKSPEYVDKFGQEVVLLDIVDSTTRHKLINTYTLDAGKKIEDRTFIKKEKKEAMIIERDKKRIEDKRVADKKIYLLEIPQVRIIKSKKMQEKVSEKQLAWLSSLGYDTANNEYTKGMAFELIGSRPASQAQINALKKWRYYIPEEGITSAQAEAAFAEIKSKYGESLKSADYRQSKSASNLPFLK